MKNPIFWIGIRESELYGTNTFFNGSITIFGSGENGNHSFEKEYNVRFDYNQDYPAWSQFVKTCAQRIVASYPDCVFMLYAPEDIGEYGVEVASRAVCQNPPSLLDILGDKFKTRQWLSPCVPILPYWMQRGENIRYEELLQTFPGTDKFVVQAASSCGGSGTFLLTEENQNRIYQKLTDASIYAISPFKDCNISPNVHLIIYDSSILLMPPSLQLIDPTEHGFTYRGADYTAYHLVSRDIDKQLRTYAMQIGTVLKSAGYRGICGIDFLVENNKIYLMEINARFQSSTFLINYTLAEAKSVYSVHKLHLDAFQHKLAPEGFDCVDVPYSFFHYAYDTRYSAQLKYMHELFRGADIVCCVDDSLNWDIELAPNTYLYKVVFHQHISAISPDFRCRWHVNIGISAARFSAETLARDMERLKIMLLSHGVRLSISAKKWLDKCGGINHEEFDALDLVLDGWLYACVPFEANLSQLSPFCVELSPDDSLMLTYYGQRVISVSVRAPDVVGTNQTNTGVFYHEITYLTNDRLRVYQRPGCYFKDCDLGCKFCDIPKDARSFSLEDILQTVDEYRNHPKVRHYLIGGGSTAPGDDFHIAAEIAKHITKTTHKPIYLMSLPPVRTEQLDILKDAGVTEVAFNLELYDRTLAKKCMPGKGQIPLAVYDAAFQYATQLWGKTGNVRTLFVVGLEPTSSLLAGVEHVAQLGVAPVLSLFRPVPGTPLQNTLAPSDDEIWYLYQRSKEICRHYGLELGPSCPYCEDNTLKVTLQ